ncbi:MAG: hypothetical protein KDA32_07140 [Phycisphaerales bacterium]|nr:hypothetical protein [Phycisphaerales bacterium]
MGLLLALLVMGGGPDERVQLDFPEQVELQAVVDYVAASLSLNVIYDDDALRKKVALRVAEPVPKSALLGVLRTILQSRGLALVDADPAGWMRIVPLEKAAAEAGELRHALADDEAAAIVTLVTPVRHTDVERVRAAVTPYLSKPGGALLALPEARLLVITDLTANVRRVSELIALIDAPGRAPTVEVVPVRRDDIDQLAKSVSQLLTEQAKLGGAAAAPLTLQADAALGGVIALGLPEQIEAARELIQRFDVPLQRNRETYQTQYVTPARLQPLLTQAIVGPPLKIVSDEASRTLLITATAEQHRQVATLIRRFDVEPVATATRIQFYQLRERRADDVFTTLGQLLGAKDGPGQAQTAGPTSERRTAAVLPNDVNPSGGSSAGDRDSKGAAATSAIRGENYSITLDTHTNSIIVIGPSDIHQQIERLLAQMDRRRPQVLVEVTLVSISEDDSLNLGVELTDVDLGSPYDYLLFTSFGLSRINPMTGARTVNAAPGATGVLIAPDEVPIVLQALQTAGNTKVFSAPRILVDDNGSGRLESVAESPFTSVNASDTVATTSFAGFAKAGTQLTIEPHIAEGDHLELQYTITVSSFTGSGDGTVPPPRTSDTISSTVRVPDGHTVVIGGLRTETVANSTSQVPLVGDVPGVGWLFGARTNSSSRARLYAFIRPTILRDQHFADLKHVSRGDLQEAEVGNGLPPNRYKLMP